MISLENLKKCSYFAVGGFVIVLFCGLVYTFAAQPPAKTDKIYKQALQSYNAKEFSNAYFDFSKIIFTSPLKPFAIYHQAVCADKAEDTRGAVKQYRRFLKFYPNHPLSLRVKYNLAQDLVEINPKKSEKYFDEIIKSHKDTDYAIASEYFLGVLKLNHYKDEKIFPLSAKNEIESNFRHYLKNAPSGKFALNAIEKWNSIDKEIPKDDYLLMAETYYLYDNYEKAHEFAQKADNKNAWALITQNAVKSGNLSRAKFMLEWGLKGNSSYVDKEDIYSAIDSYLATVPSKYATASSLFSLADGKGKDYLLNVKCRYSPSSEKLNCYKNLYLWYPQSEFVDEAKAQIFLSLVLNNRTEDAQKVGTEFLNEHSGSKYYPMVMYNMGKVSESKRSYRDYITYYRGVISKFPDSYYAYRSFLRLHHTYNPIIADNLNEMKIVYPYKKHYALLEKLVSLGDFEVAEEIRPKDNFIKSWVLYQKGDVKQGMLVARDAMDKLQTKPPRNDVRWRLVYPIFYYDIVKDAASKARVTAPLMLSLIREESYFDENAKSFVGAKGLMQLMPVTATEIAAKKGISSYNLSNPHDNVLLGSFYYSYIKNLLGGYDVSAIAAYNGGHGAVNRWKQSLNYSDTDAFVEQIPYPETQNYVKKVLRTYWNYFRIYDETD